MYSTEEQVIGKWIDGKPLYEKTFTLEDTISANSYIDIDIGVRCDEIIIISGFLKYGTISDQFIYPFGIYMNSSNYVYAHGLSTPSQSFVRVGSRTNYGQVKIVAIVKYTKTND